MPDPAAVADRMDAVLEGQPGTVGAAVVDLQTGELLYGLEEEEPLIPASAVKVLTATAALSVLGADHTYTTRTLAVPQGRSTTVVLDGGGDVLLGTGQSDQDAVAGRAGLGTLAQRTVEELRERTVTGPVTVHLDDTGYSGPALSPQWHERVIHVDVSPVVPIATYGGGGPQRTVPSVSGTRPGMRPRCSGSSWRRRPGSSPWRSPWHRPSRGARCRPIRGLSCWPRSSRPPWPSRSGTCSMRPTT